MAKKQTQKDAPVEPVKRQDWIDHLVIATSIDTGEIVRKEYSGEDKAAVLEVAIEDFPVDQFTLEVIS